MNCYCIKSCKKFKSNECLGDNCVKLIKLKCLYDNTLLSEKQRYKIPLVYDADGKDEANFSYLASLTADIENWVKGGYNLYIYSSTPGNGKTSWSLRFIQEYINKIWYKSDLTCKALFISVPMFLIELKESFNSENTYIDHIKKYVKECDLVVWDDIATKSATEFEHETLLNIIDYRLNQGKANIFNSNLRPEELSNIIGARLASRIINTSVNVPFIGQDKRGLRS